MPKPRGEDPALQTWKQFAIARGWLPAVYDDLADRKQRDSLQGGAGPRTMRSVTNALKEAGAAAYQDFVNRVNGVSRKALKLVDGRIPDFTGLSLELRAKFPWRELYEAVSAHLPQKAAADVASRMPSWSEAEEITSPSSQALESIRDAKTLCGDLKVSTIRYALKHTTSDAEHEAIVEKVSDLVKASVMSDRDGEVARFFRELVKPDAQGTSDVFRHAAGRIRFAALEKVGFKSRDADDDWFPKELQTDPVLMRAFALAGGRVAHLRETYLSFWSTFDDGLAFVLQSATMLNQVDLFADADAWRTLAKELAVQVELLDAKGHGESLKARLKRDFPTIEAEIARHYYKTAIKI